MTSESEAGSWSDDFSHSYLERLYARLQSDFDVCLMGDFPRTVSPGRRPTVLIRHDVDVSLERAAHLAERESVWGIAATYHVMLDSPFYDVHSAGSVEAIRSIAAAGHEVGLHYDCVARNTADSTAKQRTIDITDACLELEEVTGGPVRSLSFHRPRPEVIGGPLRIAGRVNGYAASLCGWYLSDSRGRWREGSPIEGLGRRRGETLQILIHPIWWGECHTTPTMRLREFLLELSPGADPDRYEQLRTALWDHILYRAADL